MKGRPGGYKLSPNEEARLLKEARETRRKQRLLQVRQQDKLNAAKIRQAVKDERNKQIQKLAGQLQDEWNHEKEEKLKILEDQYTNSVNSVGQSHTEAVLQEPQEEKRALLAEVDRQRALIRHHQAVEKLQQEAVRRQEEERKHIISRQNALEQEKARASRIAAKPPPPPDPINNIEAVQVRPIKFTDLDAFSATHLHIPDVGHVEKAEKEKQVDARDLAKNENERTEDLSQEQQRLKHEQRERARLRHKHALQKELLKNDYQDMLHDLSDLQRADMQHRQTVVAKIPKQIFLPPHRRLVEKEDTERDKEQAFEEMYMASTEFLGDLSLALDPHPPPETPTITESLDLSVLDPDAEITGARDQTTLTRPSTQASVLTDVTNTIQARPVQTADSTTPDGLKRLLHRIKTQRNQWSESSAASEPPGQGNLKQSAVSPPRVQYSPSQHTLTSEGTQSTASQSGTQGTETDTLTTVTETQSDLYSQLTVTDTTVSHNTRTATESTITAALSEGTLTPSSADHMLLHPIEKAARVRQERNLPTDLSGYLENQRQKQLDLKYNTLQIQDETELARKKMLEQKLDLEKRLAEIEVQRSELTSQLSYNKSLPQVSSVLSSHVTHPASHDSNIQGARGNTVTFAQPPTLEERSFSSSWPTRHNDPRANPDYINDQYTFGMPLDGADAIAGHRAQSPLSEYNHYRQSTDVPTQSALTNQQVPPPLPYQDTDKSNTGPDTLPHASQYKVQQYQQRLLEKQKKNFNELNQSRQELSSRAKDLLSPTTYLFSEDPSVQPQHVSQEPQPRPLDSRQHSWPSHNQFAQPESTVLQSDMSSHVPQARPLTQSQYSTQSAQIPSLPRGLSLESRGLSVPRHSSVPGRLSYISDLGQFQDVDVSGSMGNLSANSRPSVENSRVNTGFKSTMDIPRFDALERRLKQPEISHPSQLHHVGHMNDLDSREKFRPPFTRITEHGEDLARNPGEFIQKEDVRAIKEQWMRDFLQSKMSAPASDQTQKTVSRDTGLRDSGVGTFDTLGSAKPIIDKDLTSSEQLPKYLRDSVDPQTGDMSLPGDAAVADYSVPESYTDQEVGFHPQTGGVMPVSQPDINDKSSHEDMHLPTDQSDPVGRSWHKELLEYSTSSSNGNTGAPQLEPPPVSTEPEPLQFEIVGPNSPPILRRNLSNVRQKDTSGRLSSTPLKSSKKPSHVSKGVSQHTAQSKTKSKAIADLSMRSAGSEDLSQHTLGDHTSWMRTMATEEDEPHFQLSTGHPTQYSTNHDFQMSNDFQELKVSELSTKSVDPEGSNGPEQNVPDSRRQSQRSASSELSQYPLSADPSWTQKHRYSGYSEELSQHTLGQSAFSFSQQDNMTHQPTATSEFRKSLTSSTQFEQFPLSNQSLVVGEQKPLPARSAAADKILKNPRSLESDLPTNMDDKPSNNLQMDDTISRQVEECLARHQELMAQTQQLIDLPAEVLAHSQTGPTSQHSRLSFHALMEHRLSNASQTGTGISEEPDMTLVSLGTSCDSDIETAPLINDDEQTNQHRVAMAEPQKGDESSLLSFEQHEQYVGSTPVSSSKNQISESPHADLQPRCLWFDVGNEPSLMNETAADRCTRDNMFDQHQDQHPPSTSAGFKALQPALCESSDRNVSDGGEFRAIDVQQIQDTSDDVHGLTLQDAFLRKKQMFIKASKKRKEDVGEKAKSNTSHQQVALGKTLSSWKRSRGLNAGSKSVTTPTDPTNIVERSSAERQKSEQIMKTRTNRLYNQLDEVKQQKHLEDRKKFYASNRDKAKEYQKNYQAQLKKKMEKKK